jgi:predicted Zn-dependent protease with MMP-like domain
MDLQARPGGGSPSRRRPRRRDRHGRGLRGSLIPSHLPAFRTRRERFDELVTASASAIIERFPRRLEHLQVIVEEVPRTDPAPWEDSGVALGRTVPATREHPPIIVVHRRPIQTRCAGEEELEAMLRQVISEQIASLLGLRPEQVDPEAWGE